jgi:hypothetical protein
MEQRMRGVAVGLLLVGLLAGCGDTTRPVGPDLKPARMNAAPAETGSAGGDVKGTTTSTTADTTGRGPGGTIGSGH